MSCDTSRLDLLLHGELDALEARRLRLHTESCRACATELSTLTSERQLFHDRARHNPSLPALRRTVLVQCEKLAERARLRSRIAGGLGFALTFALVVLLPLRHSPAQLAASSEVNASFCDPVSAQTSFSRALHCGGGELVAQAEVTFAACLVASPLVAFGPDACE